MVGQGGRLPVHQKQPSAGRPGECLLELQDLSKKRFVHGVSLSVRGGEILGVFGLQGSGRGEAVPDPVRAGQRRHGQGEGQGTCRGAAITADAMLKQGFVYLNDNRKRAGLFLDMSAAENMACPSLDRLVPERPAAQKEMWRTTRSVTSGGSTSSSPAPGANRAA